MFRYWITDSWLFPPSSYGKVILGCTSGDSWRALLESLLFIIVKVVSEPDLLDERGVSFPETPRSLRGHIKVCLLTKGHGSFVRSFNFSHYLLPGQTTQSTSSSAAFDVERVRTWFDAGTDLNGGT